MIRRTITKYLRIGTSNCTHFKINHIVGDSLDALTHMLQSRYGVWLTKVESNEFTRRQINYLIY